MSEKTGIAWCDHTFNPWWGCSPVSAGCENCYAQALAKQYGRACFGDKPRWMTSDNNWLRPRKWDRWAEETEERRLVFCGSMMDWAENCQQINPFRYRLWDLIKGTPYLTWLLLTKRADRIAECLPDDWGDGYKNVWLGVTTENQAMADERIPLLLQVPAVCRFVSLEPMLEPVDPWMQVIVCPHCRSRTIIDKDPSDLKTYSQDVISRRTCDCGGRREIGGKLDWIIVGGESGPGYRPMDLDWARKLRDDCRETAVPFFFKQSGGVKPGVGVELDGELIQEFPTVEN